MPVLHIQLEFENANVQLSTPTVTVYHYDISNTIVQRDLQLYILYVKTCGQENRSIREGDGMAAYFPVHT